MLEGRVEARQPQKIDVGALSVFCGHENLREEMAQSLARLDLDSALEQQRAVDVLLDAPTGWALCLCHRYATQKKNTLVLTANPCPEYILLLRQKASVLPTFQPEEVRAFLIGKQKEQPLSTPLSPKELLTLKLVATDHTNCEIARERGVSEQTVKNNVRHFQKLNLRSRLQCYLYLFGSWEILLERGWSPPPHVNMSTKLSGVNSRRNNATFS